MTLYYVLTPERKYAFTSRCNESLLTCFCLSDRHKICCIIISIFSAIKFKFKQNSLHIERQTISKFRHKFSNRYHGKKSDVWNIRKYGHYDWYLQTCSVINFCSKVHSGVSLCSLIHNECSSKILPSTFLLINWFLINKFNDSTIF